MLRIVDNPLCNLILYLYLFGIYLASFSRSDLPKEKSDAKYRSIADSQGNAEGSHNQQFVLVSDGCNVAFDPVNS